MPFRIPIVILSALLTSVLFQNCGSDIDYEQYNDSLSSSIPTTQPVITEFPNSQINLNTGDPLSLAVVADGGGLSYAWYKNNVLINGAVTMVYELPSSANTDSGTYKIVVSNDKGSAEASVVVSVTTVANPTPTPTPVVQQKPVCSVWHQSKNDSAISATAKDGAYSNYLSGKDKDCDDNYCGIRMGVSCTSGDEIRLKYQYRFFSQSAAEVTTPWSGLNGTVKWGVFSQIYNPNHPKEECRAPLLCGIRVVVETKSGQTCNISYQYHAEEKTSPLQSNGAWSYLPDMGGRDDNCGSGPCGMRAVLSCP